MLSGSCSAGEARRQKAFETRYSVAFNQYIRPVPCHVNNNDEQTLVPQYIGQFTKGMQHNSNGVPSSTDYQSLLTAVASGLPSLFEQIQRSMTATVKYTNPQAGLFINLVGADVGSLAMPPAPLFSSNEMGSEFIELSWMALSRDINFDQYGSEPVTLAAITELDTLVDYKGIVPVTASNLFRSPFIGCTTGPYISQFMYHNAYYGLNQISQKLNPPVSGKDYMLNFTEFLKIQNGESPSETKQLNGTERYIINGRDLAHYVHGDVVFQAYHIAGMILLDMNAPLNPTNPYVISLNQKGFGTFGAPFVSSMVAEVAKQALTTVWYQKWFVNRRIRPEAYGGFVERTKLAIQSFPVNAQTLTSQALADIFAKYGTYLLPQAFPEGSPTHPSYGAGHATVSAACVTLLKAFFDGSYVLPSPVVPDATGHTLLSFVGPALTVEGELNKLSSNIGVGRNIGGVHWLSDYIQSVYLGEQVAINFLRDYKTSFNEGFVGWTFNDFEGNVVSI
jgi:membrane-associated phospholipid phosphatase